MRHLVLGGGGFIGSHLASRLQKQGHYVHRVDVDFPDFRKPLFKEGHRLNGQACPPVRSYVCDLRHPYEAAYALRGMEWDVVWQLAADMGGVEYFHSDKDWQAAVNNQIINANVMDAVAKYAPAAKVIFTSTACALAIEKQTHYFKSDPRKYANVVLPPGDLMQWELTEEDILWGTPDQLYGQEKRNSAILWNRAPLNTRVCFLHTVYGPYQEHSGIRMKFPSAVAQKARKARASGKIELLGNGQQLRTYLYIEDAIDRLVALGASDTDPGFLNIGGVTPYTVDEVARIAITAAGARAVSGGWWPEFIHIDGPTGVEARAADMTKFNTIFGSGVPSEKFPHTTLQLGMRKFIDWLDVIDP